MSWYDVGTVLSVLGWIGLGVLLAVGLYRLLRAMGVVDREYTVANRRLQHYIRIGKWPDDE